MTRGFEIDIFPNYQRELTGEIAVATKEIRGHLWQAIFRVSGVTMRRDGKPVEWLAATNDARKFTHAAANFLKSTLQVLP